MKTPSIVRAACAALGMAAASATATTYTITDLGTLGGDSTATSISENGFIAGSFATSEGSAESHAFLYDRSQVVPMQDLGTLGGSSFGRSVNNAGQVVGWCDNVGGLKRSFIYTPASNDPLQPIASIEGDNVSCRALAINNAGQVAGDSQVTGSFSHVFLYAPPAAPADLGGVLPGDEVAYGLAMNEKGTVVGSSTKTSVANAPSFPIVSTAGGTTEIENTIGWIGGEARGVNNFDRVVGFAFVNLSDTHAFFHDGATMKDLGTLGGKTSIAYDINDANVIVGSAKTETAETRAFVHSAGKMTDLNGLLVGGTGWILLRASAINNLGQIVGQGTNPDGKLRAFLLTPVKEKESFLPPTLKVKGRRNFTTTRAKRILRGTAAGVVTKVSLKNGRKAVKVTGTTNWRAKVKLKPGRNRIVALATGPGGPSKRVKVTIIRK